MRFAFRELPAASGGVLTPRPVVDTALEGLDAAPVGCLLHHFIVTIRANDGYLDIERNP
jgi:hypothetical protein